MIHVIGAGPGARESLTVEAAQRIEAADCLIGSRRMLEDFSVPGKPAFCAVTSGEILSLLDSHSEYVSPAVLLSGDVGFYSGARKLIEALGDRPCRLYPGISSVQYFCARLGIPWQDVRLVSLHGREGDPVREVARSRWTFFLTGGEHSAGSICLALCRSGLGEVQITAGERLSYIDERITRGSACIMAGKEMASPCVLLVENIFFPKKAAYTTHGIEDCCFLRAEGIPMTKSEVRAVSLFKLRIREGDIVYDVGAGTGSVSVEAALRGAGLVYAIEREERARALIEENRRHFGCPNLRIIPGEAPAVLEDLPAPDRVFVGGVGQGMLETLRLVREKNPKARVVANAITIETASRTLQAFDELGFASPELIQISAARGRRAGDCHMLLAQNPIFILSAGGEA